MEAKESTNLPQFTRDQLIEFSCGALDNAELSDAMFADLEHNPTGEVASFLETEERLFQSRVDWKRMFSAAIARNVNQNVPADHQDTD